MALDQIKTSLDITLAPAQPQTAAGLLHVFQDIYWIPNIHQEMIHHLVERRMVVVCPGDRSRVRAILFVPIYASTRTRSSDLNKTRV
ncbi:MAG: hypothetical protein WCF23_02175 [Candidatus Nitrosopolaris sp.]